MTGVLDRAIRLCRACPLSQGVRLPVPGAGQPSARVAFVGEAPGRDEDLLGRPFSGEAGRQFDALLSMAGLSRGAVLVTNTVHCRPKTPAGGNRTPTDSEAAFCARRWLDLEVSGVRVIVAMGATAIRHYLGDVNVEDVHGVPTPLPTGQTLFPTYHPASVLYQEKGARDRAKALVQDFLRLASLLGGKTTGPPLDLHPEPAYREATSEELRRYLFLAPTFALDTETLADARLYLFSVSARAGEALVSGPEALGVLAEFLGDSQREVWLHNAVFDLLALRRQGIGVRARVRDTMVAAYNLEKGRQSLKVLAREELGMTMRDYAEVVGPWPDLSSLPRAEAVAYSGRDADATWRLKEELSRQLAEASLTQVFLIDCGSLPFILEMSATGVHVDVPYFQGLRGELRRRVEDARLGFVQAAGQEINPNSHPQVAELLYGKLKLPILKRTEGGKGSTDEETILRLKQRGSRHPALDALLVFRAISKVESTYVRDIPARARDGWLFPEWKHTRTETGRLSAAEPNVQNQPIRDEEFAKLVRDGYDAPEGYVLLESDFSQIELRVGAHESQEPKWLEVYRAGGDFHEDTRRRLRLPSRRDAKTINFGVAYGLSAYGFQAKMLGESNQWWELDRCEDYIRAYFREYPVLAAWMRARRAEGKATGYAYDWAGRRRYVPELFFPSESVRESGEKMVVNMPWQGGAAEIIRIAMGRITTELAEEITRGDLRPCMQIHDSLVFYVRRGALGTLAHRVKELMEGAVALSVPVLVELKSGGRWGSMEKLEAERMVAR